MCQCLLADGYLSLVWCTLAGFDTVAPGLHPVVPAIAAVNSSIAAACLPHVKLPCRLAVAHNVG